MDKKLTFGELTHSMPFVIADRVVWRKLKKPKDNELLPNGPAYNAMTVEMRNPANDAYYGHFADDFDEFILASTYFREVAA